MNHQENKELDDFLRRRLEELNGPDANEVWEKLSPNLTFSKRKKSGFWLWFLPLLMLSPLAIFLQSGEKIKLQAIQKKSPQKEISMISLSPSELETPQTLMESPPMLNNPEFSYISTTNPQKTDLNSVKVKQSQNLLSSPTEFTWSPMGDVPKGPSSERLNLNMKLRQIAARTPAAFQSVFGFNFPKNKHIQKPLSHINKPQFFVAWDISRHFPSQGPATSFGILSSSHKIHHQTLEMGVKLPNQWIFSIGTGISKQQISFRQSWQTPVETQLIQTDTFLTVDFRQRKIVFNVQTKTTEKLDTVSLTMTGNLQYSWVTFPFSIRREFGKGKWKWYPGVSGKIYVPISSSGYLTDANKNQEFMKINMMSKFNTTFQIESGIGVSLTEPITFMIKPSYVFSTTPVELYRHLLSQKMQGFQVSLGLQYHFKNK